MRLSWPFRSRPHTPLSPAFTEIRRKPSLDFSLVSMLYVFMTMFMCLAAINSQTNLLFGVFGLMLGLLLVSMVINRVVLRKLSVRRVLPDHSAVGSPMTAIYEFSNDKKRWPILAVSLAELEGAEGFVRQPHSYVLHLGPKSNVRVPTVLVPKRRGLHEFSRFQISSSFPFGFIKRAVVASQEDHVLIYPPLAQVSPRLLSLCISAGDSGVRMKPRRGGLDEFYGIKEFRTGENPRLIYWRRSARTGVLVSKEMTHVAPPRVMLLVDTFMPNRSVAQHERVERCIAMAASLGVAAIERDLSVGLLIWSNGWQAIEPARGKRQCTDLLSVLARAPLNEAHDMAELLDHSAALANQRTTTVLFTPRPVQLSLQDRSRGNMLVAAAESEEARQWFTFAADVKFATCMPLDQQPTLPLPYREAERFGWTRFIRRNGAAVQPPPPEEVAAPAETA